METLEIDAPLVLASLLILGILLASAVLWIRQVQRPRDLLESDKGVSAWSIGWVNFGIFICSMITAVIVAQSIGVMIFFDQSAQEQTQLTPETAIASVLLLQIPMIGVFYLARRFYPGQYAGALNQQEYGILEALKKSVPLFVMLLPAVWITTLIWSNLVIAFEKAGLIESLPPQQLVTLFQAGGELWAMITLALMAVILAPIVEEIIFRGCIYRFLKSQMTILPAQLISSAVFAFMHGNTFSFIPLIVVGVLLARVYEKTGSIVVAIWFHAFFNALSLSMLFLTGMSDTLPSEY
jgi:membrane protease YdiL (CAAX protease family)